MTIMNKNFLFSLLIILGTCIFISCSNEVAIPVTSQQFIAKPELFENKNVAIEGYMYQWMLFDKLPNLNGDPVKNGSIIAYYLESGGYSDITKCNDNNVIVNGIVKEIGNTSKLGIFEVTKITIKDSGVICWSAD